MYQLFAGANESVTGNTLVPVVPAESSDLLWEEVEALPPEQVVAHEGPYLGCVAAAVQIPHILYEIGRQRELTFRVAQEGTGHALDLDWFDTHYLHLFLWNLETAEVIGAYRLGPTDAILPSFGSDGLYTSTLFTYQPSLLEFLTPALEMGRSFVRPEYQKSYCALLLLWKSIGQFVVKNPRYKRLFGAVSMSNAYGASSRHLLMEFLRTNDYLPSLATFVTARHPPQMSAPLQLPGVTLPLKGKRIDELGTWISALEDGQRSVPILFKQYLKLGGKLLGFNQDPMFSDVLDGLLFIDLTQTNPKVLSRYMGWKGMTEFLANHGDSSGEECSTAT